MLDLYKQMIAVGTAQHNCLLAGSHWEFPAISSCTAPILHCMGRELLGRTRLFIFLRQPRKQTLSGHAAAIALSRCSHLLEEAEESIQARRQAMCENLFAKTL